MISSLTLSSIALAVVRLRMQVAALRAAKPALVYCSQLENTIASYWAATRLRLRSHTVKGVLSVAPTTSSPVRSPRSLSRASVLNEHYMQTKQERPVVCFRIAGSLQALAEASTSGVSASFCSIRGGPHLLVPRCRRPAHGYRELCVSCQNYLFRKRGVALSESCGRSALQI